MGRDCKTPPGPRAVLACVLAALTLLGLTSCLPTDGGGGGNNCTKPFDISVTPDEIKNGKIYISLEKLSFLFDSAYVLEDVELEVLVSGKRKLDEDLQLDMNGVKLSRHDGHHMCDRMDHEGGDSRGRFKLHKMRMNGGLSFELFLLQLRFNRGKLMLGLNGRNLQTKNAVVHFKGKVVGKCPPPPPPPPPQPKPAAHTTIDAVTPPQSPTSSTSVSIAFSADQTGVTFYCSLDGAPAGKCASPQSHTALANGAHSFSVYSVNSSGSKEVPPAVYNWTVDSVAPTVTLTNAGSLPGLTNLTQVSIEFEADTAATFQCSLDQSAFAACASPAAYTGLSEGTHHFEVRAIDQAGNVSGQPAVFNWSVDVTAPVASILSAEPAAAISNADHRAFEFAASESAGFECAVDNGAFAPCVSPLSLAGLADGSHYFEVRATDLAGNRGVAVSAAWKVDTVAPQVTIGAVVPPPGLTSTANLSVEFAANEVATVYCSLDGAPAAECASPFTASGLSDGAHELSVHAVDAAGNASAVTSMQWQIDTTAPVLSFASISPSAAAAVNSNSLEFAIQVSEDASLEMSLNANALESANPLRLSALADGAYVLTVSAVDPAGNTAATIRHEFIVDTVAPLVTVTAADPRDPTNSDARVFTLAASEPAAFACDVDSAGFAPCDAVFTLSGLADGLHVVNVRATDAAGNSALASAQWTVDTRAPRTSLVADQQGVNISFNFSADEPSTFVCALDGAVESPCASPVTFGGLTAGAHSFKVVAIDAAANRDPAGVTHAFTVVPPIDTIITGRTPSAPLTNSTSATFTFAADQTASAFECALDAAAFAPCVSPVSLSGLANGAHSFRVRAIDVWGVPDATPAVSTWTVDTAPPVVNNLSTSATTNSITVTWTTSEPATDQLRYGVGFNITAQTAESSVYVSSHSLRLTGLSSNTTYSVQVFGRDQAGNTYLSGTVTVRTSR